MPTPPAKQIATAVRAAIAAGGEEGGFAGAVAAVAELAAADPDGAQGWLAAQRGDAAPVWLATKAWARELAPLLGHEREQPAQRQLTLAIAGGLRRAFERRIARGEAEELPGLAGELGRWGACYATPPGRGRRGPDLRFAKRSAAERQAESSLPDRLLRAFAGLVAEQGYSGATVLAAVERAGTSKRSFYEHFANRKGAVRAAVDSASSQMLAAALPAYRRGREWPEGVRLAGEALLSFAAREPEYARLAGPRRFAGGEAAMPPCEAAARERERLLAPGYELAPEAPAIAAEAIVGAVDALVETALSSRRGALALAPLLSYVSLAPFLGCERAWAAAVE